MSNADGVPQPEDGWQPENDHQSDDGGEQPTPDAEGPVAEFDMEFVPSLPAGQVVTPVESEGRFTWLVVEGHVSPQAREEFVTHLRHIVGRGMWRQDWPGEPPEPAA
ncbi:hypothetical protein AB0C93_17235 [Streptomyces sp. NPDC048518]|uniref:hypothetical protein n=1 Tax=Streptomyces sp. NPDC048518 TaxID=3155029 RepID=UPI0034111DA9